MSLAQSCPSLCNPMDLHSLPGSSGVFQARTLEWVAIPFSRRSSWHSDWTQVSCIAGRFFTAWATREALTLWFSLAVTPWTAACQASLSITSSQSLLKLMSIESVMPSNHLILCRPLLLPPSNIPSIRVFSNESVLCIRWPKFWSFSFSISPSNEYSGLISFRMDWLHLIVQGTLETFLQHHGLKASVLLCSAFFIVQISHPHMTTGKTIALTRRTFVGKVMSLLSVIQNNLWTKWIWDGLWRTIYTTWHRLYKGEVEGGGEN